MLNNHTTPTSQLAAKVASILFILEGPGHSLRAGEDAYAKAQELGYPEWKCTAARKTAIANFMRLERYRASGINM